MSYSGTDFYVLGALSRLGHETSLITKHPTNSIGDAAMTSMILVQTILVVAGIIWDFLEKGFYVLSTKVTYTNRRESSFCTFTIEGYPTATILENTNMIIFVEYHWPLLNA